MTNEEKESAISRFSSELDSRFKKLQKWLRNNDFQKAILLKEEIERYCGNYIYYGGSLTSGEYAAIILDTSSGERSAIVHEYSFERVSSLYSKVFEIRQSTEELVSKLRQVLGTKDKVAVDSSATSHILNLIKRSGVRAKLGDDGLREFIFSQRAIKSDYEISEIESAIGVASRALEKTINAFTEGISTGEIARTLNKNILEEGGTGTSFETDVRLRRNLEEDEGAEKLSSGDLVLFDFGAKLSSEYLSDVGRTIPFSSGGDQKVKDFMNTIYSIKKEGLDKIRAGRTGNQVRADIDAVIEEEHGFISTHRPGHQIGLNVHEPFGPALAYGRENAKKLKEGNVVTWEPGTGLSKNKDKLHKNRFGMAHVEDMVLVGSPSKLLGSMKLEYW